MKKWILASVVFLSATSYELFSQTVGIGNTSPNSNALLEIGESPGEQGLLLPRLKQGTITGLAGTYGTTEQGMLVYDVDNDIVQTWDGASWNTLGGGTDTDWLEIGGNVVNPSNSRIGIGINFPEAKVHINGGTQDTALFAIGNGDYSAVFAGANVHVEKNLGIGVTNPTNALEVSGNIEFSEALMPNGIAGTTGQFLVSSGAGSPPVWRTVAQDAFQVNMSTASGGVDLQPGSFKPIPFDFEVHNIGSGTLPGAGVYKVGHDGLYNFDASITLTPQIASPPNEVVFLRIINSSTGVVAEVAGSCIELSTNACTVSISTQVRVSKDDEILVEAMTSPGGVARDIMENDAFSVSWFSGHIIAQ